MAQQTFYVTTGDCDANITAFDTAYPPAGTPVVDTTATGVGVERTFSTPTYFVTVGLLCFDTSGLPDNAIITGATLGLYVAERLSSDSRSLTMEWYSAGTIGTEDWTSTAGTDAHSGTDISTLTLTAYNDFTLSSPETINLSGSTGLRLHISGGVPAAQNYVIFSSYEEPDNPARLIVDYIEPEVGRRYKRLVGPQQLPSSAADLYTVPAGTRTRVRNLHVSNPSGSPMDVSLARDSAALLSNSFDSHLADETTITEANSGSPAGDAWDLVQVGGTGVLVYDNARAAHGSLSARLTLDGANGGFIRWSSASIGSQIELYGRMYVYRTAQPTPDNLWLVRFADSGVGTSALIMWGTTGKLRLFDSTLGTSSDSTQTMSLNTWLRIEWRLVSNPSSGIIEAKIFTGDDTSPIETITKSSANTLTLCNSISFGQYASLASGSDLWMDDIAVGTLGYLGPPMGYLFQDKTVPAADVYTTRSRVDYTLKAGEKIQGWAVPSPDLPFTVVLDDANRADENPINPANWTIIAGGATTEIISNRFVSANSPPSSGSAGWKTLMPASVFVHLEFAVDCPSTDDLGLSARRTTLTDTSSHYEVTANGNGNMYLGRRDSGTWTQFDQTSLPAGGARAGDAFGLGCVGGLITGWYRRDGVWSLLLSATDDTYPDPGYVSMGFYSQANALAWDNFGSGTIAPPLLDDFNRADGGIGSSWTVDPFGWSANTFTIESNRIKATAAQASMYWNTAYSPDSWVSCSVPVVPGTGKRLYLYTRVDPTGKNGYAMAYQEGTGIRIVRVDNAIETFLDLNGSISTLSAGDVLTFRSIGGRHTAYVNYVPVLEATDSAYLESGYFALYIEDTTTRVDNFCGGVSVPTFPTTGLLDDFNRSDENPITTNWTTPLFSTDNTLAVLSNKLGATAAGWGGAYYDLANFGPDCEAYATIDTLPGTPDGRFTIWARATDAGGSPSGYQIHYTRAPGGAGNDAIRIIRADAGTGVELDSTAITSLAAGDAVGIRCVGARIESWKRASGVWSLVKGVTDATYQSAGRLAVEINGGTARLDNFSGGTIPRPTLIVDGVEETI